MALVPKEKPAKIGVLGGGAFSVLSLDKYKNPDKILVIGGGASSVIAIDEVTRFSFAVMGGGAASKVSVEYVEEEDGGVVVPLTLHYETEPLAHAQMPLPLAFWYFVPVPEHVRHSCAWKMWIPTTAYAHMTLSCFYALDVAYHYPQFSYSVGLLTQKLRKTFLHWKMGQLKTDLSAKIHLNNTMYTVTITKGMFQASYEFRNWDKTDLCLSFDMGQNYQTKGQVSLANTTGIIEQKDVRITLANTTGKNTLLYSGFGAEYKAESNNEPVYGQVTLGYQVNSFEGIGFDTAQFTLGWAQEATAEETEFGLYYSQTYLAYSEMRLAYARNFSVDFIRFSLHSIKERFLLHGITIPVPFGVRQGVVLPYDLQGTLVSNPAVIDMPLHGLLQVGFEIDCKNTGMLGGSIIDVPARPYVAGGGQVDSPYNLPVVAGVVLSLADTIDLRVGTLIPLDLNAYVRSGVQVAYDLLSYTPIVKGLVITAPMLSTAPIVRTVPFTISDPTGVDPDGLDLTEAQLVAEEGSYGWQGTFYLEKLEDLNKFTAHSLFTCDLGADTYVFMVDAKNLVRSTASEFKAVLKGISPSARLVAPRAKTLTKTWETATTAHDIINEVLDGYPALLEIINWGIPASRFGVEKASPMDVIEEIAAAVGGVVDTLPDGTLRVRSKYPLSVPQWGPFTVDHTYDDDPHVFSADDNDVPIRVYDKFRIMDAEAEDSGDRLEYTEITSTSGEVRVYPAPWRTTAYLDSTSPSCVIGPSTLEIRDEEETIEIYNGEGQTQFPILSVNLLQWLEVDLLGVVAGGDSTKVTTTHATEKYSLLKINYKTRCLVYPVSGAIGQEVQFLLRNP